MRLFFRGQRRRLSPGCTDTARRRFASLVTLHRTCCGELSGLYLVSLGQEVSEPWGKLKLTPGGPVWPPLASIPSLFFLKKKKSVYFYLSALGLCRSTGALWSLLWSARPLLATRELLVVAGGIWFPDQGLNLGPLHWELGVLATGPAGKFPSFLPLFFLLSAFKSPSPFLLFLSFPFIKNDREDFPSYASFS